MPKGFLKEIAAPPTLWQRLAGSFFATMWTKVENPPLAPEKVAFYYGALAGRKPDLSQPPDITQMRIVRALIWADCKARQYRPRCRSWYPVAASTFPDDERCAFYVAALCYHGALEVEEGELERLLGNLVRNEWRESAYWIRLDLPRTDIVKQLTDTFTDASDIRITPERIPVLEAAFDSTTLTESQRLTVARWLSVAYRASGRSDDRAEIIYRYLFLQNPDDLENNKYLANLFAGRGLEDTNASVVFSRMVSQAEKEHDESARILWSVRLARSYVAQNRLGVDAIPSLQTALLQARDDRLLEAALAYSISRSDIVLHDPSLLKHLETAIAFETEFVPFFTERQWQWALVPRALALGWGKLGRRDSLALFIYGRATELCPEEKVLWGYHARALAEAGDRSRKAILAYDKAYRYQQADEKITLALGLAYAENRMQDGSERRKALLLWEALYRSGVATAEIISALVDCYLREERLGDTAMELLQRLTQSEPVEVAGPLLLRLAQEWQLRGDFTKAVQWFRAAEQAMPEHFPTLLAFGLLLKEQLSDFAGAVAVLGRAVMLPLGTLHLEAQQALGESLLGLDRREEARQVFHYIVERIDPNHTPALLNLARLNLKYEEKGMVNAELLYERAAALEPSNPETYRRMAELYRAQGNSKMEQWALEQFLKTGPQDADQYRQLADLYLRRREFDKAESALRQVIALGKGDREVYILLGDIIQQGQQAA